MPSGHVLLPICSYCSQPVSREVFFVSEAKDLDMIRQVVKEEINSRAIETEKFLLDEIERRHKHLEEQMKKVQKNLEDLDRYYR